MITGRNLLILAAILVGVFLITTQVSKCTRAKPVTKHTENRLAILKSDSLLSIIDTQYRAKYDSLKQAYQDTLSRAKANYKVIVQKDVQIEYRYRQAPTVAGCDTVIDSKNLRIATLESMAAHQDQVNRVNDSLLTSFAGSIRAKDQTIGQLNKGYEQAALALEHALKPKRWGIGIMAGAGVGITDGRSGPMIGVGLSYNLIRF